MQVKKSCGEDSEPSLRDVGFSVTPLLLQRRYPRVLQPVCVNDVTLAIMTKSSDVPVASHLCSSST